MIPNVKVGNLVIRLDTSFLNILNKSRDEIRKRQRNVLTDCFVIGWQLLEARNVLRANFKEGNWTWEGKWHKWLETEVVMDDRQATRFINTYEKYGKKGGRDIAPPLLNTPFSTLAELADPAADPATVKIIEDRIENGEKLTHRVVCAALKKKKQKSESIKEQEREGGEWTPEWVKVRRELFYADLREHPKKKEQIWMKKWMIRFIGREYGNK